MKLGLQIPRFHWAGGPDQIGPRLGQIARAGEDAGYASLWLMDHFFQIASIGKVEEPMLESYTTLGFLAASTSRIKLGTLVTGVHFRQPGVLVKQVTTLDVLSGGRAWLGIGAGWYEREARGLGLSFPRLKERFEQLEETLKIAHQMWRGDQTPFYGKHARLAEPLNSPPPISQPHPPILIGGGGERKTLRLVARYADACNFFARLEPRELSRKLETLRRYCDEEGRDYDHIHKTVLAQWNPARVGADAIVAEVTRFRELGFDGVIASLVKVETLEPIEIVAREVIPRVEDL